MSLTPGTRLGPYEIVGALGAGGMGEVYRAKDTKLDRAVAIKVLPESFALDADRVARFTREAKTLAALNHPNIAAIYGLESSSVQSPGSSVQALVMELVEGEDLSALIGAAKATPSGPGGIPLADALPIAKQIADALEAAHEAGIVHRDLKPANIKVRTDGTVKVLDFGLAKAILPGAEAPGLQTDGGPGLQARANSPTMTSPAMTAMGMIIGTAAYMSPEQARGRPVDRRADIWAFGVVLYEMLAGRRAFEGEDLSITLANVLKEEVPWSALPTDTPQPLKRLLRRCLEKDPKRRLSAIADARLELEEAGNPEAATSDTGVALAAHAAERKRLIRGRRNAWIAAAITAVVALGALASIWWPGPALAPPPRVAFSWPVISALTAGANPAVSPDGRWIAYVSSGEAGAARRIWLRGLGDGVARPVAGTEGATRVVWTPQGESMVFASGDRIGRVAFDGGVTWLGEVSGISGIAPMPSGDLLVAGSGDGDSRRLLRVPSQGGTPVEIDVSSFSGTAAFIIAPQLLPDGKHLLYLGWSGVLEERALYVASIDGGAPAKVIASEGSGRYADGHLFFTRNRALYAQPFDPSSLRLSGDALQVASDVAQNALSGETAYSVSDTGVLAFRPSIADTFAADLVWFDRGGREHGTVGDGGNIFQFRLSPDGRRVAMAGGVGTVNGLKVLELGNQVASALTSGAVDANDPVWSNDSQSVAYAAVKDGVRQIFTHRIGSPSPTLAFESKEDPKWLNDWSPDGAWLLFQHQTRTLYAVKPGDPASLKHLFTAGNVDGAHFSPDGRWIAYQVGAESSSEVWVASFPAFDQRRQVSRQGGGQARWRGDGRELYFLTPQGQLMSVGVTPSSAGGLDFGAPAVLFQTPITMPTLGIDQYSVTKDGQRFLVFRPRATGGTTAVINVIVNWKQK